MPFGADSNGKANVFNLDLFEDVEWEFEYETGAQKATGLLTYSDKFEGWLGRAPAPGSKHPDIPALLMRKLNGKRDAGGIVRVRVEYESNSGEIPGRGSDKVKRYSLRPTAGEEHLLTNYQFKDLSDAEKQALLQLMASDKSAAAFSAALAVCTSEIGIKAVGKVRKGQEAYLSPGLEWVERFTTKNLDDLDLSKHLKTTENPPGPAPSPGSERNYLYIAGPAEPNDDGETWNIEKVWKLSERGKWDEDFYPAQT